MIDEKYPNEEYWCKKCKQRFTPAYFPVLCPIRGCKTVMPFRLLKTPERDWSKDPTYFDYVMKKSNKNI